MRPAAIEKKRRYDALYMDIAQRSAEMSHAERRKVGCVIVHDHSILAYGFNGMPAGMLNTCEDKNGITLPQVIHAERNALSKLTGLGNWLLHKELTLYVTKEPCIHCARAILTHSLRYGWSLKRLAYRDVSESKPDEYKRWINGATVIERLLPDGSVRKEPAYTRGG